MNFGASLRQQSLRPRTVIPVVIALAGLLLAMRSMLGISLASLWAELADANPLLLLAALGVFYLSFPVRALRWHVLLRNAEQEDVPPVRQLTRMMVIGSFANSVTVAQLGDVYRSYLLKDKAGVPLAMSLGTLVAERLLDLVTLIGLLALGAFTAYHGQVPPAAEGVLIGGVVLSLVGVLLLFGLRRARILLERVIPSRWHSAFDRFEAGAVRSLRRLPLLLLYSVLGWLIEGATLWLLAAAIGVGVTFAGAIVAGLVASLASVEPLTPGGLGVTEPGIVLVLSTLGVGAAAASAIALLNRLVNYASLAAAGAIVYFASRPRKGALRLRTSGAS